jgi:mannose/cellobiose epimerase-like protein (N-acyl-D-glucosamine 2-epimerase family)
VSSVQTPTANQSPAAAAGRLESFVRQRSLPLWATSGFDRDARGFHERLDFQGNPIRELPRRMMVQARQIVVYARSSLLGWYDDREHCALVAFETARQKYRSPDGNAGWVFSIHPDGTIADPARDLYAHAFVLYMLAWMYKLNSDPAVLALADTTLSEIDQIFFAGGGPGYLSKVPGATDTREQNPHMHLFEALLALAEAGGAERYLARANAIVDLFDLALADPTTGTVREIFDAGWRPQKPAGANLVEPGHQLEWAWLLREWERLSGRAVDERVSRLTTHATAFGIDAVKGLVRSSVQEDGKIVSIAARVWPQTEAIRALCRADPKGSKWPGLVAAITENLFAVHLPARLNGGWIDQINEKGQAAIDYMPASTLYHLVGAVTDSEDVCERVRRS